MSGYVSISACRPLPCLGRTRVLIKPLVMAAAAQTHSACNKLVYAADRVRETSQYTVKIALGPTTVTQADGLLPTEDPLQLTLIYPVEGFSLDPVQFAMIY